MATEGTHTPSPPVSVAVVDDHQATAELVGSFLRKLKLDVRVFTNPTQMLETLESKPADIVITDLRMPNIDGLEVLKRVKARAPTTDVIVISGDADKADAIQAVKLGAFDFFEKPVHADDLTHTITRTVRYRTVIEERNRLSDQLSYLTQREAKRWGIESFVGKSKAVQDILHSVRALQKTGDTSVLITGESGTGKELVARAIHYGGPRSQQPFVPLNCSAVPAELAESILFGHVRGAFTGATLDKPGLFRVADRGTLFLDEIGDMPTVMQAKLLRVLEDGMISPVGGATPHHVNVRVIAATNSDLNARVAAGSFRSDLFFRLAAYALPLPPLRERQDDIPLLVDHFVKLLSSEMGIPMPAVLPEAMALMRKHTFPGNVRELKNMIERALIESGGQPIGPAHLRMASPMAPGTAAGEPAQTAAPTLPGPDELSLAAVEAAAVRKALLAEKGNVSRAARRLGITRSKLYRKLADMGESAR